MKPVPPVVLTVGGLPKYRVPPQQRSLDGTAYTNPQQTVSACKDQEGKGQFTLDSALKVFVTESVYPGSKDEPISNKWVYVLKGKTLVAEAHAVSPDKWEVGYHLNSSAQPEKRKLPARTQGCVRLDAGPPANPIEYKFFLSPVRLTPKAFNYLMDHLDGDDNAVVKRTFELPVGTIAVPDPFRWACDAHRLYYQPALDGYQQWAFDEKRAASLFIAGVLKSWMGNGDPAGIKKKKCLQDGQPDTFLQEYKTTELALRTIAETAMAYVARCVQGPEHRVVELAAEEAGGADLANEFCQFAAVTLRATETQPGRQMLADLMADNDRFPRKYVFTDHPKTKGFEFPEWRFAWLAALAVFEQIVPAWIKSAKFASVKETDMLLKYLESLGVKTLKGRQITLYRNLRKGKPLDSGFGKSVTSHGKFVEARDNLFKESKEFKQDFAEAQELKGPTAKLEKVAKVYEEWFKPFALAAGAVIEVANFMLALDELIDAKGDKGDKVWGLAGASAHLGIQIGEVAEALYVAQTGEELTKAAVRRLAGVTGLLGFVTGLCEMREFAGKAGAATGQNDYGQAVGLGIEAAGAATVALGGGMALTWWLSASGEVMFASAAGGPIGLVVGAIGSIIIISGCVIVAWFRDNHYQSFAKLCCFGQDADSGETVYLPWAPAGLSGHNPLGQAKVLRNLLANFVVTRQDRMQDNMVWLTVKPGYLPANSVFEIWYTQTAWNDKQAPAGKKNVALSFEGTLKIVDPDPHVTLTKIENGPGEAFPIASFQLEMMPANDLAGERAYPIDTIFVRLNIEGGSDEWTPKEMYLVKVPPSGTHTREYSSLDTGNWIGTAGEKFEEE